MERNSMVMGTLMAEGIRMEEDMLTGEDIVTRMDTNTVKVILKNRNLKIDQKKMDMVMDTVMEPKKKKATLTDMVIHMDLII